MQRTILQMSSIWGESLTSPWQSLLPHGTCSPKLKHSWVLQQWESDIGPATIQNLFLADPCCPELTSCPLSGCSPSTSFKLKEVEVMCVREERKLQASLQVTGATGHPVSIVGLGSSTSLTAKSSDKRKWWENGWLMRSLHFQEMLWREKEVFLQRKLLVQWSLLLLVCSTVWHLPLTMMPKFLFGGWRLGEGSKEFLFLVSLCEYLSEDHISSQNLASKVYERT